MANHLLPGAAAGHLCTADHMMGIAYKVALLTLAWQTGRQYVRQAGSPGCSDIGQQQSIPTFLGHGAAERNRAQECVSPSMPLDRLVM
jgi:hypothetical protein